MLPKVLYIEDEASLTATFERFLSNQLNITSVNVPYGKPGWEKALEAILNTANTDCIIALDSLGDGYRFIINQLLKTNPDYLKRIIVYSAEIEDRDSMLKFLEEKGVKLCEEKVVGDYEIIYEDIMSIHRKFDTGESKVPNV